MYRSIQFSGYKLFSEKNTIELDEISNVNVIIGKNNSGKSSLLDVIEMAYDVESFENRKRQIFSLKLSSPITKNMVQSIFSGFSSIGHWNKTNYWEQVEGKNLLIELGGTKNAKNPSGYRAVDNNDIPMTNDSYFQRGLHDFEAERKKYIFKRLSAERNITPEQEMELKLSSTGEGASNLVRVFLNDSLYDESIIEELLLDALNRIMYPEAEFESIRIQQVRVGNDERAWEIFLKEEAHERVPLSKSGSGIKTIILVLLNLIVVPRQIENKGNKIIYGFEELENNLHPAMQRRLFDYIYEYAIENNTYIFLTTHSHIAINTFYDKEKASIYHVIKNRKEAVVKRIDSYLDKTEILDDLDVRASDILQSNGIIWVEGPSDRIYIKKWLDIFCNNKFEEGKHYQFLYYGGRLLSQYSAQEETELINIITTNRNAAIVIDSDKRNRATPLNNTKKRIIEEFNNLGMFSWVTKGKEIENYISKDPIAVMINQEINKQCGQYELFPDYIEPYYKNFMNKKVPFANEIKDYMTKENSNSVLDLKAQIEELYKNIENWNK